MEKSHIFKTIDFLCGECNVYYCYDGLWVINPRTKEWIVHVASQKLDYLWYNYDIFNNMFEYLSFNINENNYQIKEWMNDRFSLNVKEHFYPDKIPSIYDWSDDFSPENVIEKGNVISDMKYLIKYE